MSDAGTKSPARRTRARAGTRIGILGGTFNPVHVAHLRCAEEAREQMALDRVLFIPTASPPHKRRGDLAPATDRLAMVRLAVRGNPAFHASSVEIDRPGRSYSVDTLRSLHSRATDDASFVFLLGADAFREIGTWKEYRTLFGLADFAVFTRPPDRIRSLRGLLPVAARRDFCYVDPCTLVHVSGNRVHLLTVTALDISASAIRVLLRRGASVRYLVPPTVESYVQRRGLYRQRSRRS